MTSSDEQGPIGHTGDSTLEVKNPSGQTITVEPGTAMVSGRLLESTALTTFNASIPVANSRIDVVVVVQNESATPITSGIASGNGLLFPTDLSDYMGSGVIPPYSARLAILFGTPGASPVPPVLDVNHDLLFMIPLAQYEIASGGTITGLIDLRVYANPSGGGAVYTPFFTLGNVITPYNGRVRLIPMFFNFDFEAAQDKSISFAQGELSVNEYATMYYTSVDDFIYGFNTGGGPSLRMMVWEVNPGPTVHVEVEMIRGGWVDPAGVSQPVETNTITLSGMVLFIQLLDQPPIDRDAIPGSFATQAAHAPPGTFLPPGFGRLPLKPGP